MDKIIEGVQHFQKTVFPQKRALFEELAGGQKPGPLIVTCSDSRVSPGLIMQTSPGDMFVCRNAGNIVPPHSHMDSVGASIEYALAVLPIRDIVVCGHTRCCGIAAILDGVEENYIADWLLIAGGAKEKVDREAEKKGLTREQKLALLVEENVRLQIKHLEHFALIKNMRRKGPLPRIHGWVYDIDIGQINVLVDGRTK